MEKPVLEGTTSTIYGDDKTVPPADIRKHLDIKKGDELKWYALPGNFALVRKSVAIAILALLVSYSTSVPMTVFAQTGNATSTEITTITTGQNTTSTIEEGTVEPTDPSAARFPIKKIGGTHAFLPIRVEVIAPAGYAQRVIPESFSPDTKAQATTEKNTPGEGLDTLRFTTNSIDTFKVTFGEKYLSPREDIFKVSVFGADEEIFTEQIPFTGTEFIYELQFTTSYKPVIPTPEENLGAIFPFLQEIKNQGLGTTLALDSMAGSIVWSADLNRVIAIILVLVVIVILLAIRSLKRTVHELRALIFNVEDGGLEELDPEYRQSTADGSQQQKQQGKRRFGLFGGNRK